MKSLPTTSSSCAAAREYNVREDGMTLEEKY
jgi:hypothetical protein